jgi:hypothetical protein
MLRSGWGVVLCGMRWCLVALCFMVWGKVVMWKCFQSNLGDLHVVLLLDMLSYSVGRSSPHLYTTLPPSPKYTSNHLPNMIHPQHTHIHTPIQNIPSQPTPSPSRNSSP